MVQRSIEALRFPALSRRSQKAPGPSVGWVSYEDGRLDWSPAVFSLLGLPQHELCPSFDLFLSFVHVDTELFKALVTGDGPEADEPIAFRIVRRDGSIRLLSAVPLDLLPGRSARVLCLFDITEDGRTGGRAGASDRVPEPVIGFWALLDPSREFSFSGGGAAILGFGTAGRVTVADLLQRVAPLDRSRLASRLDGSSPRRKDRFAVAGPEDGVVRHVEFTFEPSPARHASDLLSGTVRDVTGEVEQSRELEETRTLLAHRMRSTQDGVILLQEGGTVIEANAAAERILRTAIGAGDNLWHRFPRLVGGDLWRAALELPVGETLENEGWVQGLDEWLYYSLTKVGRRLVLQLRERTGRLLLKATVDEMADRWAAALSAADAFLIETEIAEVPEPPCSRREIGDPLAALSAGVRARIPAEDLERLRQACRVAAAEGRAVAMSIRCRSETGERTFAVRGSFMAASPSRPRRFAGLAFRLDHEADLTIASSAGPSPNGRPTLPTFGQVRAARGLLKWSVRELAQRSKVSIATINRFEADPGSFALRDSNLEALQLALVEGGAEFATVGGRPALIAEPQARPRTDGRAARPGSARHGDGPAASGPG